MNKNVQTHNSPPKSRKRFLCPTYIANSEIKTQMVMMTEVQIAEFKSILNDYGLKAPKWLRRNFRNNRFRSGYINQILNEAGLDRRWCEWSSRDGSWAQELHQLWHDLNAQTE